MNSKRTTISDYIKSLLKAEVCNRCPLCGDFEKTVSPMTNHHINHDASISEYWNLIRICESCHKDITDNKGDGSRDRKVKQIKKDLFRQLIGPAAYEVLLLANKHKITSSLVCLAEPLIKLELIEIAKSNVFTAGTANHPTINDYRIRDKGGELIDRLNLK